jgi:glycerophosphoryl diester phosphodiesterase
MKISVEQAKDFFDKHPNNTTKNFLKNHQAPLLRTLNLCLEEKDDVSACLSDTEAVIKKITDAYQNPNSRKYYLQSVLFFVDGYPGLANHVDRKKYFDAWSASKVVTYETEQEKPKKENIDYEEIEQKVQKKYGVNSQEALFIDFYKEVPVRLDFYDIHVYNKTKDLPEDLPDKYLNLETRRMFFKKYNKTNNKYGDKEIYLSQDLVDKIKYNLKHNPRDNLFRFKNKDPGSAIKTLLNKAGIKNATMNTLRHSVHSQKLTAEERVELARRSGHSVETSVSYKRPSPEPTIQMEIPTKYQGTIKHILNELKGGVEE